MSTKSSLNFARMLSMLDWEKNGECLHVSVTYGGRRVQPRKNGRWKWPVGAHELELEKQGLVMAVQRAGFCGVWRLEFQSRESAQEREDRRSRGQKRERGQGGSLKVPHFHLLLWCTADDRPGLEVWLHRWWRKFSGNKSEFAVRVTAGDQARGSWYLAMHAAKREQAPPFAVGRWWGYIDRERVLKASDLHSHGEITERERVWWARLYRRATGAKTRNNCGLSWFLPRKSQTEVNAWVMRRIADEQFERHRRPPF